jgi:hypothetical protein
VLSIVAEQHCECRRDGHLTIDDQNACHYLFHEGSAGGSTSGMTTSLFDDPIGTGQGKAGAKSAWRRRVEWVEDVREMRRRNTGPGLRLGCVCHTWCHGSRTSGIIARAPGASKWERTR